MAEVRIIRGNVHRSKVASNLLRQIQAEREADLLLMSEQCDNPNVQTWNPDETGTATLWITNPGAVLVEKKGQGVRYVWIKSKG